jgi:hypothetical protein
MLQRIDSEGPQAVQVDLLNIQGRRLDDDLILIVVLKPVRIFAISPIRGTAGRFHIGHFPRFRP